MNQYGKPHLITPRGKIISSLSIGSNLGDRLRHLKFAVQALANLDGVHIKAISGVYETAAHVLQGAKQPDYLNAVLLVETDLLPEDLLSHCLQFESQRGRKSNDKGKWQPRPLDIDILTYGTQRIQTHSLVLPHPRMADRRFVLEPLFEIAPELEIPSPFDRTVQYLLDHCKDNSAVTRRAERLELLTNE